MTTTSKKLMDECVKVIAEVSEIPLDEIKEYFTRVPSIDALIHIIQYSETVAMHPEILVRKTEVQFQEDHKDLDKNP